MEVKKLIGGTRKRHQHAEKLIAQCHDINSLLI